MQSDKFFLDVLLFEVCVCPFFFCCRDGEDIVVFGQVNAKFFGNKDGFVGGIFF